MIKDEKEIRQADLGIKRKPTMKNLTIEDIQKFADSMHERFIHDAEPIGSREMAYGRMVKVSEEVGELADAVLSSFKRQRVDKPDTSGELGSEMADVILAVAVLARGLDINIETALQDKMEKILKRNI